MISLGKSDHSGVRFDEAVRMLLRPAVATSSDATATEARFSIHTNDFRSGRRSKKLESIKEANNS